MRGQKRAHGRRGVGILVSDVGVPWNAGYRYRERIAGPSTEPVLDYLARIHRHSSATEWAARLTRGEVEVDGVRADVTTVVRPAQWLVWHRPPWEEPEVDDR